MAQRDRPTKQGGIRIFINQYCVYLAWVIALIAVGGSLYFSEVLDYEPCKLCWIQRICMYPLVILLGIASYRSDKKIIPYVLPLSIIGGLFSTYHYMEEKIPALAKALPCTVGIPCNFDYLDWLGFITIPLLAFTAFVLITVLLILGRKEQDSEAGANGIAE